MKTHSWMLAALASLGLLTCSGCAALLVGGAAAAGAGTVAYIRGELNATLDGTLDRTTTAARTALKDLEMPITVEEKTEGVSAKFTARASGDKKVTVTLKKATGTTTKVSIRVGFWGDETLSREILERIKKHL